MPIFLYFGTALLVTLGIFAVRRLSTYMRFLQQEEYDSRRFLAWLITHRAFDKRFTAIGFVAATGLMVVPADLMPRSVVLAAVLNLAFLGIAWREPNPTKHGKKKLALTARAKRILWLALVIAAMITAVTVNLSHIARSGSAGALWAITLAMVVPVQLLPLTLIAAVKLLGPQEARVQRRFWHEAHDKLKSLSPTVIAVTGSYGKTSTKHVLAHILSTVAPTLATPGSVNTPMGIARIVREQLTQEHRFFVVEMGAYGRGSIKRLCDLSPPDQGIITAVGLAHYERFATLEAVFETKFELQDAVQAKGGTTVVAAEAVPKEPLAERAAQDSGIWTFGAGPGPGTRHFTVTESRQTEDGIELTIADGDHAYALTAPVYGAHMADNIAASFALAVALGIAPNRIAAALKTMPQVRHRLEVQRQAGGVTVIDDAYNANPVGFASGLELLDLLAGDQGRRILVTPGMVELGAAHDEEHRRLGELAGRYADLALVILPDRIPTFLEGFQATAPEEAQLVVFSGFDTARAWLEERLTAGDVVLLENDLPDLYEARILL